MYKPTIVSFNCDSRLTSIIELSLIGKENNAIIYTIQDPPTIDKNKKTLKLIQTIMPEFQIINEKPNLGNEATNNDQSSAIKTNNLILVNTNIVRIKQIHRPPRHSKLASSIGISIEYIKKANIPDKAQGKYIIFSTYIRPKASYQQALEILNWMTATATEYEGKSRVIILGDFNATNLLWAPTNNTLNNKENSQLHYTKTKEIRGRAIAKYIKHNKFNILNRVTHGPTFRTNTNSIAHIDLAITGSKALREWSSMRIRKVSDIAAHRAIILQTNNYCTQHNNTNTRVIKRIQVEKIEERHFEAIQASCNKIINNWKYLPRERIIERLNKLSYTLYQTLIEIQLAVTSTKRKNVSKFRLGLTNARTRNLLNKLKLKETKSAKQTNKRQTSEEKARGKRLTKIVNKTRDKILKIMQQDKCFKRVNLHLKHNPETNAGHLWESVKICEQVNTESDHGINHEKDANNIEDLNSLNGIEKLADDKFPNRTRSSIGQLEKLINNNEHISVQLDDREIDRAIYELRNKNYTSPEGIKMKVFYIVISEYIRNIIRTISEMSFETCYIPIACRTTQGTIIPKKMKGQFRIVHISSPISAVLELIALHRLEYQLEMRKLNSPYQFGFSALTGRHDLIARLMEICLKNSNQRNINSKYGARTTILSLDIEGAFDNVDQDMLIDKMNKELRGEPIRLWLAEYMLNRDIRIKYKNVQSTNREVCQGVPQGSALGPTLWNHMIHNIEVGIVNPTKTEILKYADDLLIVTTETNNKITQMNLNQLIYKLEIIKLRVRPEKCSHMSITTRGFSEQTIERYKIYGSTIEKVKTMNILGVPITHRLRLDTKYEAQLAKITKVVKKLHTIKYMDIVNSAMEWRTLIDSHLNSIIIVNCWPILLTDPKAREWCDKILISSIRIIFEWPDNLSTKLIRLITKTKKAETIALSLARNRSTIEGCMVKESIEFLIKMNSNVKSRELTTNTNSKGNLISNLEQIHKLSNTRKQFNPVKLPTIIQTTNEGLTQVWEDIGPVWISIEAKGVAIMVEVLAENILQTRTGRHAQYPIEYFNRMALILNTVNDSTILNRNLVMSRQNSLLGAILNTSNRDNRIIKLRELLYDKGWRIYIINREEENIAQQYLKEITMIQNEERANDTIAHNWTEFVRTGNISHNNDNSSTINTLKLTKPELNDYVIRNQIRKELIADDIKQHVNNHTRITRSLCSKVSTWQNMNPSWLSGDKMLMLTGMTNITEDRSLQFDNMQERGKCHQCSQTTRISEEELDRVLITTGMNRDDIENNIILHRTFQCNKYKENRDKLLLLLDGNSDTRGRKYTIATALNDRKLGQTTLRLITKCAIKRDHT